MFWKRRALYLVKANNDLCSHCTCDDAPIGLPRQLDCPWCGCGWLFTCIHCHKAFTFAKAVRVDCSLRQLGELQAPIVQKTVSMQGERREETIVGSVDEWVEEMRGLLAGIESGRQYVYFDGRVVPAGEGRVRFKGLRRGHDLPWVPQVQAMRDPTAKRLLGDIEYWRAHDRDE